MKHSLNLIQDSDNTDSADKFIEIQSSSSRQYVYLTLEYPYREVKILLSELKQVINLY